MTNHDKLIDIEHPPITETAVLVRLVLPGDSTGDIEESLEEMRQLAWTAGAEVKCTVIQHRPKPCPATLIGAGKVEEVKAACDEFDADFVAFDSDLAPNQGAKLERLLGRKVVDRTQLILDIFAQRAQTTEGKHQVELAQLQYLLPRLAGRGTVMRQQGGIGIRGPGEQKLEMDRRIIRVRIERLRHELEQVRKARRVQRKKREQSTTNTVALVGYTNAGKSSLLRALTGADVLVENKLFATLDTRSRLCRLPGGRDAVFTDTVGFIRKLPHSLVAAFRATLEEVVEADLLLLVVDVAHPAAEEHVRAVYSVLDEIGAGDKPVLTVLNKIDLPRDCAAAPFVPAEGCTVRVSARTGEGLDRLLEAVDACLVSTRRRVTLRIPQERAGVVAKVHDGGRVLGQAYEGNDIVLDAELDSALERQLAAFIA